MSLPRIAIIIPVYNTAKYLNQCLDSILLQTFQNYIVFATNDHSSDGSREILERYQQTDSRFRLIDNNIGRGVGNARNSAIRAMLDSGIKFDFVYFMDSDDYLDSNVLAKCIDGLTSTQSDYAVFSVNKISKTSKTKPETSRTHEYKILNHDEIVQQYFRLTPYYKHHPSSANFLNNKIFSFNSIKNIRFDPSLKRGGDAGYFLNILPNLTKGILIEDAWFNYRLRKSSITCQVKRSGAFNACLAILPQLDKRCELEQIGIKNKLISAIWTELEQILTSNPKDPSFFRSLQAYRNLKINFYKTDRNSLKRKCILELLPEKLVKVFFLVKIKLRKPKDLSDYFE